MDTCSLTYSPNHDIVFVRWLAPDTFAQVQHTYRQALVLALAHRCGSWLLDARHAGGIRHEETLWLSHAFFPQAVAELAPRPLRMAVLSSAQRLAQMHADAAVAPAVQAAIAATQPYEAAIFMGEADAVGWLRAPAG